MTYSPLVSIITPTYNHQNYISECIESVINQSFTNWEMIIVDDGSNDNTGEICKKKAIIDPRIKYFRQENKGIFRLKETYNFALSESSGELIAILEGDDYWYKDKLLKQVEQFGAKDIVFSWCIAKIVSNDKKILGSNPRTFDPKKDDIYNNKPNGSFINILLSEFPIPATWIIQRKALNTIGGFKQIPEMPTIDLSTIIELTQKGDFCYVNEPLVAYRRQVQQATRTLTVEISLGTKKIVTDFLAKSSPELISNIGIKKDRILTILDNGLTKANSIQGRSNLVKKDFAKAKKNYIASLTNKSDLLLYWRLKSFGGLICAFFKIDIEWLAKILKKNTYK